MARLRQPRLAEIVAAELRTRIVSGELPDDSELPSFESLVEEFDVSTASVREALRILENEGLLTLRRGAVGGAVVHRPTAQGAAYMLGLILQSRRVAVSDVSTALSELLALCAEMCARRIAADPTVGAALRRSHDRTLATIDADALTFANTTRDFHMAIVAECGNESFVLVAGALEALWSGQADAWHSRLGEVATLDESLRRAGVAAHEEILVAIEAGDAERARSLMQAHCIHPDTYGHAHEADTSVSVTQFGPTRSFRVEAPSRWSRSIEPTATPPARAAQERAGQQPAGQQRAGQQRAGRARVT
jgi:DNA-binding FadR family transcriptional regulator